MVVLAHWLLCREQTGVETQKLVKRLTVIQGGKDGGLVNRDNGRDKEVADLRYFWRQT